MIHFGFMGSHRTGKTTLAVEVAKRMSMPYVDVNIRGMLQEIGVDPKAHYTVSERLSAQLHLLDCLEVKLDYLVTPSILDRTPMCLLMYMQADILRDFPEDSEEDFKKYEQRCLDMQAKHFVTSFLIQPGIHATHASTSANFSAAYMSHLNRLIMATCFENNVRSYFVHKGLLDFEQRVSGACKQISYLTSFKENAQK